MIDDDPDAKPKWGAKLVATVGATCAATLLYCVPQFEGMILKGYKDPIGIVTACAGETKTAVLGRAYTLQECQELLRQRLVEHAEGVLACVPELKGHTNQLAAATSFTYNVGVKAFCDSTMAEKFREGNTLAACAQLSRWTHAGGRELPGLVERRRVERKMCEGGNG